MEEQEHGTHRCLASVMLERSPLRRWVVLLITLGHLFFRSQSQPVTVDVDIS